MPEPNRPPSELNEFEREFARPLTRPQAEEGIGPTLGEDVGVEHQRDEDRRNGATRAPDNLERT